MTTITANELGVDGIALIEAGLKKTSEIVISVEGKNRFVVMDVEHYQQLQDMQQLSLWQASEHDIATGAFHNDLERHLARVKAAIES